MGGHPCDPATGRGAQGFHPNAPGGMLRCPARDGPATRFSPLGPAAATAAAGAEAATPERQRRWQSYFVRVGSLSAKLRHRALRRSLGELQRARHSAQQVLAQLHHIIELVRMWRAPCQPRTRPGPPTRCSPTLLSLPLDRARAAGNRRVPLRCPPASPPHVAGVEPPGCRAHGGERGTGWGYHGEHRNMEVRGGLGRRTAAPQGRRCPLGCFAG